MSILSSQWGAQKNGKLLSLDSKYTYSRKGLERKTLDYRLLYEVQGQRRTETYQEKTLVRLGCFFRDPLAGHSDHTKGVYVVVVNYYSAP